MFEGRFCLLSQQPLWYTFCIYKKKDSPAKRKQASEMESNYVVVGIIIAQRTLLYSTLWPLKWTSSCSRYTKSGSCLPSNDNRMTDRLIPFDR